jgi:hypothetical protein
MCPNLRQHLLIYGVHAAAGVLPEHCTGLCDGACRSASAKTSIHPLEKQVHTVRK